MNKINLHMTDVRRKVGVSLWLGQSVPTFVLDCINNNMKYFQDFYFITNDKDNISEGIVILDPDKLLNYVDKYLENVEDKTYARSDMHPAQISDILCYKGLEIMKEYGVDLQALMVVDTDIFLYNQFLINELFSNCKDYCCFKDENLYIKYLPNEYTYNTGCSFSCIEEDKELKDLIDAEVMRRLSKSMRYTAIGPGLVNSPVFRSRFEKGVYSSNIQPFSFDPHTANYGRNIYKVKKYSLGLHITHSIVKEIGLDIDVVFQRGNEIILMLKDLD